MTEREKVQKAFNQCSDALCQLDQKLILKVFHLLSVQFDIVPNQQLNNNQVHSHQSNELIIANENHETIGTTENSSVKKTQRSLSRKGKSSSKNPTFLSDFDFRPNGYQSLKEFYNMYVAKSNFEKNLIFVYYLQNILNADSITVDHIFSCYKHLGIKIPLFPQTLIDTKARKGWIETSNLSSLKTTREGINFLEHDLPKKTDE